MTDEKANTLESGHLFGHYRILKQIGAGGMGEVYLAEDSRLRRKIALKVLRRNVAKDDEHLRRFEQEAFAASGLSHPNIVTIYEFGEENGMRFLAAEFVDGKTLRELMQGERLTTEEILQIAIQTAEALSAAHEAKIIHRDVKPENIVIRPDHLVKVLDFGLAKLTEKKIEPPDPEAETIGAVKTEPGVIMGTVAYMSPEQARGKETDARTDIWSLGCVLYEMIGGKKPFRGETTADCIVAIIKKNHAPLAHLNEDVPAHLEEIVSKCLEKDREERYQTIKDLLIDLRRLKKKLEFEAEKERSAPEFIDDEAPKTRIMAATTNTGEVQTHTVSSAEYVVRGIVRHKFLSIGILAFLALTVTGVVLYKSGFFTKASIFASPQKLNFTVLAASGKITETSVSPDGNYVAYVTTSAKGKSIRLRQIATNSDVEIVAPKENKNPRDLRFTPDGNHIYYIDSFPNGTIYKVPTLPGGTPTKIAEQTSCGAAVSPDGKTIAFIRSEKGHPSFLQLADADGSNERTLLNLPQPYSFYNFLIPAWSPDGKSVSYVLLSADEDATEPQKKSMSTTAKLWSIRIADGSQQELSSRNWSTVNGIVWLPDRNLIVSGNERSVEQGTPLQLWLIAPNTEPQRITNDLNNYYWVSATVTGEKLVTTQSKELFNLWSVPDNDPAGAAQVPSTTAIKRGIKLTPDGKFIYSSTEGGGHPDIWTMNIDGTDHRRLTARQGTNSDPSMTADGRYIVFVSDRLGENNEHIFRMDADGSNQKQLTDKAREWSPRLSPDGKWVYYSSAGSPMTIRKISIEGGEPIIIMTYEGTSYLFQIDLSPRDGMVAYEEAKEYGGERKIVILAADGAVLKTLTLPLTASLGAFHWTPDGRAIAFVDSRNIWTIAIDGNGKAKPLTNFKTEAITDFSWFPGGKQLALIRGTTVFDAVLIGEAK